MPNTNDEPPFFTEKQAAPDASASSEVLASCATLKAVLTEIMRIQTQLDGEHWTSSPAVDVEDALRRIRAARRECSKIVDELLEMSPTMLDENVALNNVLTAYLAQGDVDRMTCHQRFDVALGSKRLGSEVTSPETKLARTFLLNIIPRKRRLKVSFPPRSR